MHCIALPASSECIINRWPKKGEGDGPEVSPFVGLCGLIKRGRTCVQLCALCVHEVWASGMYYRPADGCGICLHLPV